MNVRSIRLAFALIWAASPQITIGMAVFSVAGGVAPVAGAWLQRAVVDDLVSGVRISTHASTVQIVMLALLLGGVGLASACLPNMQRYATSQLRRELGLLIQDRVFRSINSFTGLRRFESPEFADKLLLVQQISNSASTGLASSGMQLVGSLITAAGMFVTLEVINPVLALIVAGTAIPAVAAQISNSRRQASLHWEMSPAVRRQLFYGQLLSGSSAAKEVRLFGLGDFFRRRMLAEIHSVNQGERGLDRRILGIEGSLSLLAAVVTAGGLVWTVREAAAGRLTVGDVTLFAVASVGVQASISSVVTRIADVYQSLLLFSHYRDIVTAGPDLPLTDTPRPLPALRHQIELRGVWFRYDGAHPWVLRDLNMTIPCGGTVALVGANGAGKSTLVKLLCRLYDPDRGSILWDGTDIRDVPPDELRQRISTVFQDYVVYDLTAAENIGIGDLGRMGDADRVRLAAQRAGMHDSVSRLPRGYDTLLSRTFFRGPGAGDADAGVLLSGGQGQRLALARGFMRSNRDLLILDEPNSGLDAEAEHTMHLGLQAVRDGRTSLLISHRLGLVRDADIICVLSSGHVAEQGSHRDLMAAGGEYCHLYTLQASGYQDQQDRAEPEAIPTASPAAEVGPR